jgi:hypothetical protein
MKEGLTEFVLNLVVFSVCPKSAQDSLDTQTNSIL